MIAARKVYETDAAAVVALDDVDLDIDAGAFTAIMGPSGSGKSTLMHCLAGLDRLTSGAVHVGDADLTTMTDRDLTLLRREKIGFVFQAFNLIPALSAQENITLPLALSGRTPDEAALHDLADVLGLTGRLHHRPAELSGGQQQRVAVARALVGQPEIVFADEPTGNLDTATGTEILGFMRRAVDERAQTTVMVTHDPSAAAWADRVVFIVDGRVHDELHDPSSDEILDRMRGLAR
ncbi:MAG: ABC transporter ATP-binding protein [Actinomycetota bacterium]